MNCTPVFLYGPNAVIAARMTYAVLMLCAGEVRRQMQHSDTAMPLLLTVFNIDGDKQE